MLGVGVAACYYPFPSALPVLRAHHYVLGCLFSIFGAIPHIAHLLHLQPLHIPIVIAMGLGSTWGQPQLEHPEIAPNSIALPARNAPIPPPPNHPHIVIQGQYPRAMPVLPVFVVGFCHVVQLVNMGKFGVMRRRGLFCVLGVQDLPVVLGLPVAQAAP